MQLHFAENPLEISFQEINKDLLEHLEERNKIKLQGNYILFKNFTGILNLKDRNLLVIPKKLAEYFGLIDEHKQPKPGFENRYKHLFENFLIYLLNELSKEKLIYTFGWAKFPVDASGVVHLNFLVLL